jgi:hypothetical protein
MCQSQRTGAVTANQNPKATSASPTLKGSLRTTGFFFFAKRSNVATVKMKATEEQSLLSGRRREFSMLSDRKSGHSAEPISD